MTIRRQKMKEQQNNSSETNKDEKRTDVSIYMAALQATYRPAPDVRHTTHWFTTDEVYEAIKQLDPSADISKDQIFQAMTEAGFHFQNRPGSSGCNFRWMLTEKQ